MARFFPERGSGVVSLKSVILIPFVGLTFLAVALVGYLSFLNGQKAVNDVALQLRNEINARILDHLDAFFSTPHRINLANAEAMGRGDPHAGDLWGLIGRFSEQLALFDSVTSINFGNTSGGLANAGREGPDGARYVIFTDGFRSGNFRKHAIDVNGKAGDLLGTVPGFDSRNRPWYTEAVEKGGETWSDVHILFTGQDMEISASRPVYDSGNNLLGVTAVNLFLSHLGDFLEKLEIGRTGQSFIIDDSGYLVASSTGERPYVFDGGSGIQQRIGASRSSSPLIRGAVEALPGPKGDTGNVSSARAFEFNIDGERHFGQSVTFEDRYGLDWLIVTVIPEADFMVQIRDNNRQTLLMMLLTLAAVSALSLFITRKIVMPVARLNESAAAMAEGEWDMLVEDHCRIEEIGILSRSFGHMAGELRKMVNDLTREIKERRKAEDELALLNARLNEKNRELEQVVYIASHDLRSPLVNIDGYGREIGYALEDMERVLAAEGAPGEEELPARLPVTEMTEALRYIRSSTAQMDSLLNGLLKLSRTGRASLTIVPLDMNDLISGVVSTMVFQIRRSGVRVVVQDLPPCLGDAVQVRQVFSNILQNGIKFLDPQREGSIRFSGNVAGPWATYCVEDNGIGIAEDEREKIFEIFHRAGPKDREGEGLGLTIARQVLSRLNGRIWVESSPGRGSRFLVALSSVQGDTGRTEGGEGIE